MITVAVSLELLQHLKTFEHDGTTVAASFFEGGRLSYAGRNEMEFQLKYVEPYTLEHEARVIAGLPNDVCAAIRLLANSAPIFIDGIDESLDVLWSCHSAWSKNGISFDRLVAAMVTTQIIMSSDVEGSLLEDATIAFIEGMRKVGFPLTKEMFEELCDGAEPACVALGMVEI